MAKLKNSNCDKTKKKKLWQKLKDKIVTEIKNSNFTKLKKLNCDNSKTQIVIVIKMTVVTKVVIMTFFSENTLTPRQPTTLRAAIRNSCDVWYWNLFLHSKTHRPQFGQKWLDLKMKNSY